MFRFGKKQKEWLRKSIAAAVLTAGLTMLFFYCQNAIRQERMRQRRMAAEHTAEEYCFEHALRKSTGEPKEALSLYAGAALLLDAGSGRVLYEKNGYEVMAMASTTKIMTCILALEYGDPDDLVTVSAYAASMPKVKCYLKKGEQYRLGDLLYSMMLQSHNDTAVAIAEHIGGSVEGFAEMMNRKARELGCTDTVFITPNGLDAAKDDGTFHSTTAYDLARIAAYAIGNERFLKIIATRSYSFSSADGKRSFTVSNADAFLDMMDGALGIKTGFTGKAGYCFVGGVKKDGLTLISVVLASGWPPNKNYKWWDTRQLMNYGFDHFAYETVRAGEDSPPVKVQGGVLPYIATCVDKPAFRLLLCDTDSVYINRTMKDTVKAPVTAGEVLGYDRYYVNDELYLTCPITAGSGAARRDYRFCLGGVMEKFLLKK